MISKKLDIYVKMTKQPYLHTSFNLTQDPFCDGG